MQAKLTGAEERGSGGFGTSVALSADGDTALIGARADDDLRGAVWVFRRRGAVWAQEGRKLTGGGEAGAAAFGYTVALSADGDTALIGGPDDRHVAVRGYNDGYGAVWFFRRVGTAWLQQGGKLTGRGDTANGDFGSSATISGDGRTALVGAFNVGNGDGAAWVFARTASGWRQEGGELTGRGALGRNVGYGFGVALSASGDAALVGGSADHYGIGAVWAYTRTGHNWRQQGRPFTVSGEHGHVGFGYSISLTPDGQTALIGGWPDNRDRGGAWVFTNTGTTWTQKGPKLTGSGETGPGRFGEALALSANAHTALIGAPLDSHERGAAWIFDARS
ncbi:MAG TPA: hypothetical protein VEH55_01760 [Gaiellaceae bacterium]|nr:hypothetical protein [Gaiellaceae bacterium]